MIYHFIVIFTDHNYQEVYASIKREAVILAQARQIEAGLNYNVVAVKKEGRLV
jgi:hypothetical protein